MNTNNLGYFVKFCETKITVIELTHTVHKGLEFYVHISLCHPAISSKLLNPSVNQLSISANR